jgi:hypothetical protein
MLARKYTVLMGYTTHSEGRHLIDLQSAQLGKFTSVDSYTTLVSAESGTK